MITLRNYQTDIVLEYRKALDEGARNILLVLPTGAGKTAVASDIIRAFKGASCAIAHRQELVLQISQALARNEIVHRIEAPTSVVKLAVSQHMEEFKRSYYSPNARCAVAGVDTIIRREATLGAWMRSCGSVFMDEAHHILKENKWGKAIRMFSNAIVLGVTATPCRADGKGLGSHADGIFERMIVGPSMRDIINMNYLTDYRVFCPPSDVDLTDVQISSATGDYNQVGLRKAVHRSHLHGDVVQHYLRLASGKLGVTFAVDIESATQIAADFNAAGVPAAVVSSESTDSERISALNAFKARRILQLVNVDLFGEGFDLPAIEVVSMARPTESYGLHVQQFGRALRLLPGKDRAIIIDHVGNVLRHGLPDAPRTWTLDRRESKRSAQASDAIPIKVCPQCTQVYERILLSCPYCGYIPVPAKRSDIKFVDGDLFELDAETLAAMRGEVSKIDMDIDAFRLQLLQRNVPPIAHNNLAMKHRGDQLAQESLRDAIALWAGYQRFMGREDRVSYKQFYLNFGIDVLSAKALRSADAIALNNKVNEDIRRIQNAIKC